MRKILLWTAGGLGLATVCGLAGLAHLSATLVTLTVFCAVPALVAIAYVWFLGVVWSLPDRIAAWVEPSASVSVGGTGGDPRMRAIIAATDTETRTRVKTRFRGVSIRSKF